MLSAVNLIPAAAMHSMSRMWMPVGTAAQTGMLSWKLASAFATDPHAGCARQIGVGWALERGCRGKI